MKADLSPLSSGVPTSEARFPESLCHVRGLDRFALAGVMNFDS